MRRVLIGIGLLVAGGLLAVPLVRPARAEHFDIGLVLRTGAGRAESGWDTSPPEGGVQPREWVRAAAGEEVELEWRLRDEYPHGTLRGVTIRLYVAPEAQIGQKDPPPPTAPRVLDNSFTADFFPRHVARGLVRFRVTRPGAYLVRLQSEGTLEKSGHEHFGAVDLLVE